MRQQFTYGVESVPPNVTEAGGNLPSRVAWNGAVTPVGLAVALALDSRQGAGFSSQDSGRPSPVLMLAHVLRFSWRLRRFVPRIFLHRKYSNQWGKVTSAI